MALTTFPGLCVARCTPLLRPTPGWDACCATAPEPPNGYNDHSAIMLRGAISMSKNLKFGLIIVVILGTLGWLAAGGINQTASYYKEIAELDRLAPSDKVDKRLRVGGDVELNSITREGRDVHFVLVQE